MPDRMSDRMSAYIIYIYARKIQTVCLNRCQIEYQKECQSICQKECQIECQIECQNMSVYVYVSGWESLEEIKFTFLVPWLQKLWGSACNSSSKLLNTFYIKSIRDCWRAVSSRSFPRYFHWFLTCTRLRRNLWVRACSEEHNPGDNSGSNRTSLEIKKRRGLLLVGIVSEKFWESKKRNRE